MPDQRPLVLIYPTRPVQHQRACVAADGAYQEVAEPNWRTGAWPANLPCVPVNHLIAIGVFVMRWIRVCARS